MSSSIDGEQLRCGWGWASETYKQEEPVDGLAASSQIKLVISKDWTCKTKTGPITLCMTCLGWAQGVSGKGAQDANLASKVKFE